MNEVEKLKEKLKTYENGRRTAISLMEHHETKYKKRQSDVKEYDNRINKIKQEIKELDNGQSTII